MPDSLANALDALFQLPPARFVAERNALAKDLKERGDAAGAERVKKLSKPTPAAWIVNRLSLQERDAMQTLIAAGTRLRRAQEEDGTAAHIADAARERGEVLQDLKQKAAGIASAEGQTMTAALQRQISATLEAISSAGEGVRNQLGRLHRELAPTGFDALMAAAAAAPAPRPRGAPRAGAAADTRLGEATRLFKELEQRVRQARQDASHAQSKASRASHDAAEAQRRAEEARALAKSAAAEARQKAKRADELTAQLETQRDRLRELARRS